MFKEKESIPCPSSPFPCSLEEMREDEPAGQSPILSPACPRGGNMSGEVTVQFCTREGGSVSGSTGRNACHLDVKGGQEGNRGGVHIFVCWREGDLGKCGRGLALCHILSCLCVCLLEMRWFWI